ncbi:outer membrane protein [Cognatilysobacter tabacisoli]|uniref:outer membrane protein n=1 Tax=Cognatilysobacter tabacisoli TaxID=2315424 RepID=UPI000E6B2E94|nr:outer membrane beta-barrel protein [Lysobacter tabacisoli]
MKLNRMSAALVAGLLVAAAPLANAQDAKGSWNGGYVGAYAGIVDKPDNGDSDRFLFDTNLDGNFNDTVRTGAGADAFSPGFCNGVAQTATPAGGCAENTGGADWGLRAGYDWQFDRFVFGVVGEYGLMDARDAVSAFSTTPARYSMLRKIDGIAALRARIGVVVGDDEANLVYATAGGARASIENTFATSNGVNTFTNNGDTDASGHQLGLGYERRFGQAFTVGVEYLRTELDDGDYRVRAAGPAPATNPFILQNPNGTDFRRSDTDIELDSLRITASYRF